MTEKCGSVLYELPVSRSGEHPQDDVPAVHPDDGAGRVEQVEVEVGVAGDGAVQAGLQERRPLLLQDALRPAQVAFTHPSYARHHNLRAAGRGESLSACWRAYTACALHLTYNFND